MQDSLTHTPAYPRTNARVNAQRSENDGLTNHAQDREY
jgi:hypothetical protein